MGPVVLERARALAAGTRGRSRSSRAAKRPSKSSARERRPQSGNRAFRGAGARGGGPSRARQHRHGRHRRPDGCCGRVRRIGPRLPVHREQSLDADVFLADNNAYAILPAARRPDHHRTLDDERRRPPNRTVSLESPNPQSPIPNPTCIFQSPIFNFQFSIPNPHFRLYSR